MSRAQWLMRSEVGPIFLVASENGLQGVFWKRQPVPMAKSLDEASPELTILAAAQGQLKEYLSGRRKAFDLPLDVAGTSFQRQVWKELARIPYGKTVSYKEIARRLSNENACRAVGTANGKNPLSIVVPCHRVIAADGSLGGYAGGLMIKKKLLELENGKI